MTELKATKEGRAEGEEVDRGVGGKEKGKSRTMHLDGLTKIKIYIKINSFSHVLLVVFKHS